MAKGVVAVERGEQYQWLDAEYGAAVIYAVAVLRAYGVGSDEFRAAEDAARDLWLRLRKFQIGSTNKSTYQQARSFVGGAPLI